MADINKIIGVQIDDNASAGLNKVDQSLIKVTQSTKNLSKETKSHTQSVIDNGGAMGLLNDLTGGLAMTFKDASEAIGIAGVSLNTFKGIMIATGIGALVLAVGYLAENWEKVADSITGAAAAQEDYNIALAQSEETRRNIANITNVEIANLEQQKQQLIAQGATKQEILKLDEKILIARNKQNDINEASYQKELDATKTLIQRDSDRNDLIETRNVLQTNLTENLALQRQAESENNDFALSTYKRQEIGIRARITAANKEIELYDINNENIKKTKDLEDKLVQTKVNRINLSTEVIKKENEEAQKRRDAIEKARLEEDKRLEQLIKIRQAIEANVKAYEKEVNETDIQKQAKALNGQYIELIKIYDARAKLIEQQKEANKLATEGGISEAEQKQLNLINQQIKEYDKLIAKKSESILQSPEADKDAQTRLDIIRLNGEAELAMLQGFTFDAINLRSKAFEKERQMREENLRDIVSKDEIALRSAEEALAKETEGTEGYRKALAVKNDLDKKYNQDKITLNEELTANEQTSNAFSIDLHNAYLERKMEIDNDYYEKLSIVSQNLQGFLSQLQDEQLVKSKDLRNVLLVAEKGLAIAGVVINTIRENRALGALAIKETAAASASYAAYDFVGGSLHAAAAGKATAGIGLNTASAGISIASILATTLTSWNRGGASGGSSGGGAGAPQAQFNIVGSSGTNQLAATIGAQQNQPVNAYVVGSDVSTQQSLDRNRVNNATFL
jgi:hypothetical protein